MKIECKEIKVEIEKKVFVQVDGGRGPKGNPGLSSEDVLFFNSKSNFPSTGQIDKVYISKDNGISWTWNAVHEKYVDNQGRTGVYKALLSQSGTNAPTAVVLQNTLGGEVVWSRSSQGIYLSTLLGAFIENKTLLQSFIEYNNDSTNIWSYRLSDNQVEFSTYLPTDGIYDGSNFSVTIEVYP